MWFGVITLFPEMISAFTTSILSKAIQKKLITITCFSPRDFALDKHKTVDDKPYGGGAGMVMMAPPLKSALTAARKVAPVAPHTIYLSPQGKKFDQKAAQKLSEHPAIIFLAGRYEGIDERVITQEVDEEWSIGDYVLTGGELPAMVMLDSIARLVEGVVGDEASVLEDSLSQGLLKHPQYTRPEHVEGLSVPPVLLNGNHELIRKWRIKQSLGRTWLKRPDMLASYQMNKEEALLLQEFIQEHT